MIAIGNFFFRWRDTAFTLFSLVAVYLVTVPALMVGGFNIDMGASVLGFLIAFSGQFARGITIGLAYIKRGGLNKQIYAENLVTRGIFGHCRNPLYLGNILIVTGVIVSVNINWYYMLGLPLFYFIYICITLAEENFLRGKFGEEYEEFWKKVPNRYIPGNLKDWGKNTEDMDFTWKRLIKKEHSTFFTVFGSLVIILNLKLHFRHGMDWTSPAILTFWGVLGAMVLFQIAAEILKRQGKLEWDPERP